MNNKKIWLVIKIALIAYLVYQLNYMDAGNRFRIFMRYALLFIISISVIADILVLVRQKKEQQ